MLFGTFHLACCIVRLLAARNCSGICQLTVARSRFEMRHGVPPVLTFNEALRVYVYYTVDG